MEGRRWLVSRPSGRRRGLRDRLWLRLIVEASAAALGNFSLAAFIAHFDQLGLAMAVLVPALVAPGLAIFWWATTETRGLSLDQAALEQKLDTTAPL